MEPSQAKIRYKLILGKFPVVHVDKNILGFEVVLQFPNNIKVGMQVPPNADVRVSDILTVYTEIFANAEPSPTPIQ